LKTGEPAGVLTMKEPRKIEGKMTGSMGRTETESPVEGPMTLESVMAEHESALLRYAARLLNNADAAQDVVQETFIRLHRFWGTRVRIDEKISHWLYRATHNAAVDYIRRESRLRRLHEAHAEETPPSTEPSQVRRLEEADRRRAAIEHLSRLDEAERQVMILRLQEGMSYAEISRITGRSEGNVGCLLHHATKKLSNSLKKAGVI
jgi:RNA polymerase sigma factor (sigma-70 family)